LGWPDAQYSLGISLFDGAKTEAQRQEGIDWLKKASGNRGHAEICDYLKQIAPQ